jgi:hypothetical protein
MTTPTKKTYGILISRHAMYEFAVDAKSPEEACKILGRELRSGEMKRVRGGEQPIETSWADPADEGCAWAVMCTSDQPGKSYAPIMAWNGTKIVASGMFSAAADILGGGST